MFFGNALLGLQLGRVSALLGGGGATVRLCLAALTLGYIALAGGAGALGAAAFTGNK